MTILTGLHNSLIKFMGKVLLVMVCIKALAGMATPEETDMKTKIVAARNVHAGDLIELDNRKWRLINEVHVDRNSVVIVYKYGNKFVNERFRTTDRIEVRRA
jgi:hypothetical protein